MVYTQAKPGMTSVQCVHYGEEKMQHITSEFVHYDTTTNNKGYVIDLRNPALKTTGSN